MTETDYHAPPTPCDHPEATQQFNAVTCELLCICGARKDIYAEHPVWTRSEGAIDHRKKAE